MRLLKSERANIIFIIWGALLFIIIVYMVGYFSYNIGYSDGSGQNEESLQQYKKAYNILKNQNKILRDRIKKVDVKVE